MSKTILATLAIFAGSGVLAACSTPSTVTTRDGRTDYTADAPVTDTDDGFVTYEKGGRDVKVNKSEVERIEEVE
ncbi:YgdI/YgdR family lipoprotein [Castellaniella denitrificans]|uniref:YgdI/YgdR family lipoprotein n=1 Tax=Castellaniella denitrificans TaxID=56119 RepID=A0ABT4M1I6_9BURK|nr:YgdI/YgdR family lipoprotein [Castellaniella denitrificans]MCZ4329177.1 YgdI/YgdR family lipoprotein [Castellaniella denitrificans]